MKALASGSALLAAILAMPVAAASPRVPPAVSIDTPPIASASPHAKAGKPTPPGTHREDPRQRLEAQRSDRGVIDPAALENLRRQRRARGPEGKSASAAPASRAATLAVTPTWVQVGPMDAHYEQNGVSFIQSDSGRMRRILPDPSDPNTVYVLSSGGGLWVSHDFMASPAHWTPLTDGLSTTSGGSAAFGRTSSVIYLGTGDPFDVVNVGGSMTKSTDGGATWSAEVDLGSALSIRDVAVDTSQATDIVLVATDAGLYRSIDGGATYSPAAPATFSGKAVWSIVRTSSGWLASAQPCTGGIICGTTGGLYLSIDQGATWNPISNALNGYSGAGRTTLAVGQPGDVVVYAFAENAASTDQRDLFRSVDGGSTWTALGLAVKQATNWNSDAPNMDLMGNQAWYNQMVVVDPRDPLRNTVYIGGDLASAKSTDGGATWTLMTNWLGNAFCTSGACTPQPYAHADFHTGIVSTAGGTGRLLFGNDGGLALSTDNGVTWSSAKNAGLGTFLFYSLTSTPGVPNAIFGGTQDNGTRVREGSTPVFNQSVGGDGIGSGWSQANAYAAITTLPNNEYMADLGNRTPDLLQRFNDTTAPTIGDATFLTSLATPSAAADPTGKVFFTSSAQQVYRTGDGGLSWTVIGVANTASFPASFQLRSGPHAVEASPVDLNHIGVIGGSGEVHFTANGGTTWALSTLNTAVSGFQSFTKSIAYADNNTIYVSSVSPTPGAIRVVKSLDGGTAWARADIGLPDVPVSRVVVDPRDATHATLLAATDVGVYRSTDAGASWQRYGTGLPDVSVADIYVSSDAGVRIATYGRGIWALPGLSFVSAGLVDDVLSCDHDGVLDNVERGHLSITLRNDGLTSLSSISATVTSTDAHVTFPNGNVATFPVTAAGTTSTAAVVVALNGAASPEKATFSISFNDATLGSPAGTAAAAFAVNYDEVAAASGNDSQVAASAWTATGTAEAVPFHLNWRRDSAGYLDRRWFQIDGMAATDTALLSPAMAIGSNPVTLTFEQRYVFNWFSTTWYDGMVLEASANGGAWADIGVHASPGYDHVLATGFGNAIQGQSAYAGMSAGYPAFVPVTVSLGTTYAGQTLRLRFRVGTIDRSYAAGVELRNISVTGATGTPFRAVVANAGVCNPPLVAPTITSANSATFTVNAAGTFTATATATPAPSFSATGSLPSGVTLSAAGVLSGTPALGTVGSYPLTLTASNGYPPDGTQAFTLTVIKASQSISFANPGPRTLASTPFPLSATATSALAVAFTSITPAVCTVSGANVTMLATGTCTIDADQAGDANFNAATQVQQSFTIAVPNPPRLANISTRMEVLTGNDVMIGGFIIGGSSSKTVVVRARGPSLVPFGITNALANPTLTLVRSSDQSVIATNDNWGDAANASAISASGFAPGDPLESAILVSLPPGAYTAIVSGVGGTTGVGIVEVFEVDHPEVPLANISTRGEVLTGNDVMIGGFIVQGDGPQNVVVRARGPSLVPFGITNALANPTLTLVRSSDQSIVATNDDWGSAANASAISASGFAPANPLESAILVSLPPGAYTAIVSGAGGVTGVGIVEVFTTP